MAKFIRFEAVGKLMRDEIRDARCEMRDASISITKFTKLGWNDGVFEGSEEHWKLWRCEVEIFFFLKRFFTILRFVQNDTVLFFHSRLGIWIIFETQRFFIIPIFLRELSWRNSFALKLCGNWCDDVVMWWCGYVVMRWKPRIKNMRHWVLCKNYSSNRQCHFNRHNFLFPNPKGWKIVYS